MLFSTSCNQKPDKTDDTPVATPDCEDNERLISRAETVVMVDNFLAVRDSILAGSTNYVNAAGKEVKYANNTAVLFSLEDMKCFIAYVERFNNEYSDLGMRAYLAASTGKDGNLAGTIVFVPTGSPEGTTKSGTIPNIPGANSLNHGTVTMPPFGPVVINP